MNTPVHVNTEKPGIIEDSSGQLVAWAVCPKTAAAIAAAINIVFGLNHKANHHHHDSDRQARPRV